MAKTATLSVIRTEAKQRAEMENSTFVADSEWNGYINRSYAELYDMLVQKFGPEYYITSSTVTTVSGTDSYALAADFYKLLGVDLLVSGTDYVTLSPFMFSERNQFGSVARILRGGAPDYRYRVQGSNLVLRPVPKEARTLKVWYIPAYTTLSQDSDTLDGVNGWEEYVIVDAAMKALSKEESDVSVLMAQKQALIQRIEAAAQNRDAGAPLRMVDVRYTDRFESGSHEWL